MLVKQVQAGSHQAFTELQDCFNQALYFFISRNNLPSSSIEDICQNTWIEVWQTIGKYDPGKGRFYTYLRLKARNQLSEYIKKEQKSTQHILIQDMSADNTTDFHQYLLETTFREGGYPHQLIAFAFSKLIFQSDTNLLRSSGYAKKVALELFEIPLHFLYLRLVNEYTQLSGLSTEVIDSAFQPLSQKLLQPLNQLVNPKNDRSTWDHLINRNSIHLIAANTMLCYYSQSGNYERDVALWSYSVLKRVRRQALARLGSHVRLI